MGTPEAVSSTGHQLCVQRKMVQSSTELLWLNTDLGLRAWDRQMQVCSDSIERKEGDCPMVEEIEGKVRARWGHRGKPFVAVMPHPPSPLSLLPGCGTAGSCGWRTRFQASSTSRRAAT